MGETNTANMDKAKELAERFKKIDVNGNDKLEVKELERVFAEFAGEFLKFCDAGDKDGELTLDEFVAGIYGDTEGMPEEEFKESWLARMDKAIQDAAPAPSGEENADPTLEDGTVTLAPYFKLENADKFKEIWKGDYANFGHKDDCVHYAFCFTEDGRAHCREAYKSAEGVIQHITDVGGVFHGNDADTGCIHPDNASIDRLEVHGPAAEIEKMKEWNKAAGLPFQYFVNEWGFRPARPAMDNDTVVHLYPYFKLKNADKFKSLWKNAYAATQANAEAEKSHQYAFSFCDAYNGGKDSITDAGGANFASCRESYADAESLLLHVQNVGATFHGNDAETGCIHADNADLAQLEVHGPADQIQKIKEWNEGPKLPFAYFITEWGFRNETK